MVKLVNYDQGALQNPAEFKKLVEIMQRENVRSYLEIGSKAGGSLWLAANALPVGARCVAVELPHSSQSLTYLQACASHLRKRNYTVDLIIGDSTSPHIIEQVRAHAPFDLAFIDGNHTLPYVTADWKNYGPMARIVAFHDIGWKDRPNRPGYLPIEAPVLWSELKKDHRHEEIVFELQDNGIGVLWN